MDDTFRQTKGTASRSQADLSHAQAELSHARNELSQVKAEFEQAAAELRQQVEAERAEVLTLKEGQGGSNKASDVIHALETQVRLAQPEPDMDCALQQSLHIPLGKTANAKRLSDR